MSTKVLRSATEDIVEMVNREGIDRVARRHRMSRHKLYRWIKEQGYISKQIYVRRESTVAVQNES